MPEQPRKDEDDFLLKKAIEVLTKGKQAAGAQVAAKPDSTLAAPNPLTNTTVGGHQITPHANVRIQVRPMWSGV